MLTDIKYASVFIVLFSNETQHLQSNWQLHHRQCVLQIFRWDMKKEQKHYNLSKPLSAAFILHVNCKENMSEGEKRIWLYQQTNALNYWVFTLKNYRYVYCSRFVLTASFTFPFNIIAVCHSLSLLLLPLFPVCNAHYPLICAL